MLIDTLKKEFGYDIGFGEQIELALRSYMLKFYASTNIEEYKKWFYRSKNVIYTVLGETGDDVHNFHYAKIIYEDMIKNDNWKDYENLLEEICSYFYKESLEE